MRFIPILKTVLTACVACLLLLLGACGRNQVDSALESDANGFLCVGCKLKFYTERDVFPGHCPQCKQPNVQQVVGFVCAADKTVTVNPRGRGSVPCQKCGQPTSALSIPGENELKAWGAVLKTRAEVGGS